MNVDCSNTHVSSNNHSVRLLHLLRKQNVPFSQFGSMTGYSDRMFLLVFPVPC